MEDKQFEPTACRMLQHTDSLLIKFHLIDKCLQCLCMPITCFSKVNYLSTFFYRILCFSATKIYSIFIILQDSLSGISHRRAFSQNGLIYRCVYRFSEYFIQFLTLQNFRNIYSQEDLSKVFAINKLI